MANEELDGPEHCSLAFLLLPLTAGAAQFHFEPGCTLPYKAIKQAHPIGEACNLSGRSLGKFFEFL